MMRTSSNPSPPATSPLIKSPADSPTPEPKKEVATEPKKEVATQKRQDGLGTEKVSTSMGLVQPFRMGISNTELAWCIVAGVVWILFYTIGLLLPARYFMGKLWVDSLENLPGFWPTCGYMLITIASYAMTNILFLCCAASVLGCLADRWQISDELEKVPENTELSPPGRVYLAAILRGFFLYLLVVGGFVLVSRADGLTEISFDQYLRIGGAVSALGFVLGYDPNLLMRIMQRVIQAMPQATPTHHIEASTDASTSASPTQTAEEGQGEGEGVPETLEEAQKKERDLDGG